MPMCTAAERRRLERGFSLVEVLCALAIATAAIAMLTSGAIGSLKGARQLDMRLGARVVLQSILEDELSAAGTQADTRQGESGPYRWRLEIAPARVDLPDDLPSAHTLYRLTGTVSWGQGASVSASALKLGR